MVMQKIIIPLLLLSKGANSWLSFCPSVDQNLIDETFHLNLTYLNSVLFANEPWQYIFEDEVKRSGHDIVLKRATDYSIGEWSLNDNDQFERLLTYKMHPNSTFVKTSRVRETQTYIHYTDKKLIARRIISNEGFMFASSFFVEVFICAVTSTDNTVILNTGAKIHSNSSVYFLVSAVVEDGTRAGLVEYYSALHDVLKSISKEQRNDHSNENESEEISAEDDSSMAGNVRRHRRHLISPQTSSEMTEAALIENYVNLVDQIGYSEGTDVIRIVALLLVVVLVLIVWLAHKRVFSMVRTLQPLPLTVTSSRPYDTDPLLNSRSSFAKLPIENAVCIE